MKTQSKMPLILILLALLCVGQFVAPAQNAAVARSALLHQLNDEIAATAEKALPAVVSIISTQVRSEQGMPQHPFEFFFGPNQRNPQEENTPQQFRWQGLGSGFLIDSQGTILTNNHVVADSDDLEVTLKDGRIFKAKLVGTDPETEVAVIKIDGKDLPCIELGDSDSLKVGNLVLTIGSPQGLPQTVTFGIVSALNRSDIRITDFSDFVQTDAAVNPGNSGGPLLDVDGMVIGINTAIFSTSGGSQGMGFAIPINQAKRIADALMKTGKVERGYMGIRMQNLSPEAADHFEATGMTGALVSEVVPGSPAEGQLETDDVIYELEGKPLKDSADLLNRVAAIAPGEEIRLGVLRDGTKMEVKVKLGLRPSAEELAKGDIASKKPGSKEKEELEDYGFSVREVTEADRQALNDEKAEGLLVTDVEVSSNAYGEGLRQNMLIVEVNRQAVKTIDDLHNALEKGKKYKTIMLKVSSSQGSQLIFVPKKEK